MRTRNTVVVGVGGLLVVLATSALAPDAVGGLLITFGLVAFVWAVVGFLNPAWGRIPNRMAAVWVFALGFGLFMAGGALVAPPEETVQSSDAPARHGRRLAGGTRRSTGRHRPHADDRGTAGRGNPGSAPWHESRGGLS